jgi:hypothetical protein
MSEDEIVFADNYEPPDLNARRSLCNQEELHGFICENKGMIKKADRCMPVRDCKKQGYYFLQLLLFRK